MKLVICFKDSSAPCSIGIVKNNNKGFLSCQAREDALACFKSLSIDFVCIENRKFLFISCSIYSSLFIVIIRSPIDPASNSLDLDNPMIDSNVDFGITVALTDVDPTIESNLKISPCVATSRQISTQSTYNSNSWIAQNSHVENCRS